MSIWRNGVICGDVKAEMLNVKSLRQILVENFGPFNVHFQSWPGKWDFMIIHDSSLIATSQL